jgi:hypothetical protein
MKQRICQDSSGGNNSSDEPPKQYSKKRTHKDMLRQHKSKYTSSDKKTHVEKAGRFPKKRRGRDFSEEFKAGGEEEVESKRTKLTYMEDMEDLK